MAVALGRPASTTELRAAESLEADASPVADVASVTYWYPGTPEPALRNVSLRLDGGVTLVAGSSGGGKSTLLRLFDGLVPQFHGGRIAGRVTVRGLDAFRTPIARLARVAGLVFQDPETQAVYGTVEREIAFALENAAMPRAEMHDRVDEALERLGIASLRQRRLATLSGGERQRVQLAAVLALRPELVALDEPTSQLDGAGSDAVLRSCLELADAGTAIVIAEHRFEQLLPHADTLLVSERGELRHADRHDLAFRSPVAVTRLATRSFDRAAWELRNASLAPGARLPAALSGIDLAGGRGEVVAVTGSNGSGKTTLLRALAGLVPPLSGAVQVLGGRVAYLPQNPAALLHLPTVRQEIELTLRRTGSTSDGSAASGAGSMACDVDRLLDAFGLLHLADRYPRDLSGGERQRAALAAVLAGAPALALLDEPTRGMDLVARNRLVGAVRELASAGTSFVVATHDQGLIADLADRVIEVGEGGARDIGSPQHPVDAADLAYRPEAAR